MKKIISIFFILTSSLALASYEKHFPQYFEYCGGTQWKLQTGEVGGSPGHGFIYIHGLCKDYRSAYPQVIPCSEASSEMAEKFPHKGVGISLDKNFSNVMWVAVPGREFMLFGNQESKPITNADIEKHIQKVLELRIFDDVISKSEKLKPFTPGTPEYLNAISLDTLGTDHAVNWARKLHCVKIPTIKEMLPKVADFLNASNNQYRDGEYVWSKEANNCIHLSINASHAMGISKKLEVDQKFIKKLLNLAFPANAFMMYADLSVLKKTPSIKTLSKDLSKKGYSVVQVGSIMNAYEVFPSGDYFNTEDLTVLTGPRLFKPWKLLATPEKYEAKYMNAENSDLKSNAKMWVDRYQKLLKKIKPHQSGSEIELYLQNQLELSKNIFNAE